MSASIPTTESRRKSGKQPKLIGCCVALPILMIVMVVVVYSNNHRPVHIVVPTPQMPNPNAYDDFVRAGKLAQGMQHKSPFSLPNPTYAFAEFEAAAKDAEPALTMMRKGLDKEYLIPPVRSNIPGNHATSFPVYASFRELARVGSGVAMYYEMDGKPAKATEARLDSLEMGVMVPRGGTLIAGLMGIACEAIATSQLDYQLPLLSEAELAHVAARLDRIATKRISFADILQEEGYEQIIMDQQTIHDIRGFQDFESVRDFLVEEDSAGNKKSPTLKQNWEATRFLFANKAAILRENQAYIQAAAEEARKPYQGKSKVPVPNNLLAQMRGDTIAQGRAKFIGMETVQAILRTEIALYRYKKAHGRFPDSLSALTPTYLPREAMIDPFSGTMLRYRSTQNGQAFLLYSIGPDMKDDLGTPSKFPGYGAGDTVAGKLRPRKTFKKRGSP